VRRWATGFWELGEGGLREGWVKAGQFTTNLRPRWTDPVTARRVPSKWTKTIGSKGSKRSKGNRGARGARGTGKRGIRNARGMRHVYNLCSCT
jgi:hypothetical protein